VYKKLTHSSLLFLGDEDVDCIGNLVCFQRSGFTAVPGCTGEGRDNNDYCIRPETNEPTEVPTRSPITNGPTKSPVNASSPPQTPLPTLPQLELVGNNGNPESAFPLQQCQGDCDNDSECQVCDNICRLKDLIHLIRTL